jgi:hypothetical protein
MEENFHPFFIDVRKSVNKSRVFILVNYSLYVTFIISFFLSQQLRKNSYCLSVLRKTGEVCVFS